MKKTCEDYTDGDRHNDYMRHRRAGEEPCRASKRAWADRQKSVRQRMRTVEVVPKVRRIR